uniref:TSP1_spondin domain-containing protein n=1 Tax=Macrostomum lignano TaxID=282301 RepID=A0A1I8FP02_9PLAT
CPKSVTRVTCIDDSRRVVTTTSWRLVRVPARERLEKEKKKLPIRGPCKRNGYRQVTFVSYRLRKCKCVRVQRKSNELCLQLPLGAPGDQADSLPLQDTGRGKKVCTDTCGTWSARRLPGGQASQNDQNVGKTILNGLPRCGAVPEELQVQEECQTEKQRCREF